MAIAHDRGLRILVPVDDSRDPQRGALQLATALAAATGGQLTLARVSDPSVTANLGKAAAERGSARILVALDGSTSAEHALGPAAHLASLLPAEVVLVRAIDAESDRPVAEGYLQHVVSRLEPLLDGKEVAWRAVVDFAATAILDTARDLEVDAIALTTHAGRTWHGSFGSTTTSVVNGASVPLILVEPRAENDPHVMQIKIGSDVRTTNGQRVGEVHRVVVDLDQQAMVAIVVLDRGILARDVLVPLEFIGSAATNEVHLRLTGEQLEQLPDFSFNEFASPPPTWTWIDASTAAREHRRMGATQHDITRATRLIAEDGELGHVDRIAADADTGRLIAFWVRTDGLFRHDIRIPAERVRLADAHDNLHITDTRGDAEAFAQ